MPNKSRRKGFDFERSLVTLIRSYGLDARRSWGSDGRSQGLTKDVDLVFAGMTAQTKRIAKLPNWLQNSADVTILRQDRGESLILLPLESFLARLWPRGVLIETVDAPHEDEKRDSRYGE